METLQPMRLPLVCCFAAILASSLTLVGCGSETPAHAQQLSTPAILTGYCGSSGLQSTAFMIGLGSTSTFCNSSTGDSNTGVPMPSAGTLKNLRVFGPNVGTVVTVLVNGTSSPLTCTQPLSTPYERGGCSDTTHTVTVLAGDLVAVQATIDPTRGGDIENIQVSLEKQ